MNKLFKSLAAVTLAMFAVACSNDKVLDANTEPEVTTEGVSLEIALNVQEDNGSRLCYIGGQMTETVTPYYFTKNDKIFVIDERGRQVGILYWDRYYGDGGDNQISYFKGENLKLQDNQKVHLWYFGQTIKTAEDYEGLYPENKLADSDIDNGTVTVNNTQQLGYPAQGDFDPSQPYDVLAKSAIVKIEDGEATVREEGTNARTVRMKHLCSLISVDFYNEESTAHPFSAFKNALKVEGCHSIATFDLVGEKITKTTVAPIYVYNNDDLFMDDGTWANVLVFPGESSPTFTAWDKDDHAWVGYLSTMNVKEGTHYIDWSNNSVDGFLPNSYSHNIKLDMSRSKKDDPFIRGEFLTMAEGKKVEFGRGNLYANGTKYPAAVYQAQEQWIFNPSTSVEAGNDDYRWALLDADINHPKYVFDKEEYNWTKYTAGSNNMNSSKYAPGTIYCDNPYSFVSRDYRLLSAEEWDFILSRYPYALVELTDVVDSYTGQHPRGLAIFPVDFSQPLGIYQAVCFDAAGLNDIALEFQRYVAEIINLETFFERTGLRFGINDNTATHHIVQMKSTPLGGNRSADGIIYLPITPGAAYTPYWTSTATATKGNFNVVQISETAYPMSDRVGAVVKIAEQSATYGYGLVRLVSDVK